MHALVSTGRLVILSVKVYTELISEKKKCSVKMNFLFFSFFRSQQWLLGMNRWEWMSVLSSLSVCILCLSYTLFHVCVFVKIKKKCLSSVLHIASSICSHPPKSIYSKRFSYRTQLVVAVHIINVFIHLILCLACWSWGGGI